MDKSTAENVIQNYQHIILFDGVCNLCVAWVHFLIKRDPSATFHFCSVQTATGKSLLRFMGLPINQIETITYIRQGEIYLRSSACLEILKQLPYLWPVLALGLYIPRNVRDGCYNFIAKNRYRFWGKKEYCLNPSVSLKGRFIQ